MIANPHIVSRLAKSREPVGLLPLSLQRVRPHETPRVPSNEERYRAFRDALPAVLGNAFAWPFLRGIRDEAPDYSYFAEHEYADLAR